MKKDFRKALTDEILLADGAMGTLLVSRGAAAEQAMSPFSLTDPAAVSEVHEDYRDAGARLLTTNTWDANRVKLAAHDWADSLEKINRAAVALAREAAVGEPIFVAGSIGPLGALVRPYGHLNLVDVRDIFEEQARVLLDAGVDVILLETFGNALEAAEAVRAVRGLSAAVPIVAQMTFLGEGRTAFGESAGDALSMLAMAGADVVGINCTLGPQETHEIVSKLPALPAPLSVMPNAGYPTIVHGRNVFLSSPEYLRSFAVSFAEAGAAIIGGCCGTTPEHVRAMSSALAGRRPVARATSGAAAPEPPVSRRGRILETSRFTRKLADAGQFLVTVELEPPRGVDVSAAVEGARALKACGVDAVQVTDNPMARLRMAAIAVAALVQRETGMEALVQMSTRDRNVLGLQSDLLGAAALGIRALLCVGGDSMKIGDYPQARQVSEVDVLGLLRMARGLNSGADLAGNAIGAPTAFSIGCAVHPAAADPEAELARLAGRREAGATFGQTPPVFDIESFDRFVSRPEAKALPILAGILPLRSLRQTLFFANEVPGMVIPDAIQERMRHASEKGAEFEKAEGIAIARELAAAGARLARGIHLLPMAQYGCVPEILEALPSRLAAPAERTIP